MTRLPIRALLLGLTAVLSLAVGTRAGEDDPKARALLDNVARAYKDLDAYSDQGQYTQALKIDGRERTQTIPVTLRFARPNQIDLDLGVARLVCDGETLRTVLPPMKRYRETKAPSKITLDTLRESPAGALVFGSPNLFLTEGVILHLLLSDDAARDILEGTDGLKLEADRKDDGRSFKVLLVDQSEGPDFRLRIDPETNLVASIDLVIDAKALQDAAPKGSKIELGQVGWSAREINTAAPQADAFAFRAPEGFQKVEPLAGLPGQDAKQAEREPENPLVGKPAPEFTITAIDGDKTKPLSKADLAGKVVMIDFWATWCGPCLKELPEVQKMVEDLAKSKKDVRVIALSVDENPGKVDDMRKLVEETLTERKIALAKDNPVGIVALDTTGEVAKAFEVEAIPMIILLDGKGIVRRVHVGYTERETLEEDIQALLEGKPLSAEKDKDQ